MATPVEIVSPLEYPEWDDWIYVWPEASPFHSAAWARSLVETYGFQPRYVVMREGQGLRAVLPMMEVRGMGGRRRGISLPFSDFCGALVREGSDAQVLHDAVVREAGARGWKTVEWRGELAGMEPGKRPSISFHTHDVDLTGTEDDQWQRCRPAVRRAVKKARNSELKIRSGGDDELMNAFYHLFALTRRRHGLPPPPMAFFRALQRNVLERGAGTIISAWCAGRAVAASLFLYAGRRGLFKYGASDARFQEFRPNDLVMWEGIRWCRAQGGLSLSLGKTRIGQDGLRRFKLGWGSQEEMLDYFTYDVQNKLYVIGRDEVAGWYNRVFRRMPLPLLRWTGRLLYHHAA